MQRRPRIVGALAAAAAFAVLLLLAGTDWPPLARLDGAVSEAFRGYGAARPGLVAALRVATDAGDTVLYLVVGSGIVAVLAVRADRRRAAAAAGLVLGVYLVWTSLHAVLPRPRPVDGFVEVAAYGFPSGHASNAAVLAVLAVWLLWPRLGRTGRVLVVAAAATFAAGVGVTRVALLAHWPSDVVGSWLLVLAVFLPLHTAAGGHPGARPIRATAPVQSRLTASPTILGGMLLQQVRAQVARYGRRLVADGLVVGTAGNLSVRAGDLVAVTPSGLAYDELTPELVCVVRYGDGSPVAAPLAPTTELPLHLAALRATGAGAVVHTHSIAATAVASVEELAALPNIHYYTALFGGPVPVTEYARFGTQELADRVAAALAGRSGCLLGNHGAVAVGSDLAHAYDKAGQLEWLCEVFLRASAYGTPRTLPDAEIAEVARLVGGYGQHPPQE